MAYRESYEVGTITRVSESETGYGIDWKPRDGAGSYGCGMSKEYGVEPKVGDEIEMVTFLGMRIKGIYLNGKRVFHKTDAEVDAEMEEMRERHEREKKERFEEEREKLDEDFAALPPEFQERIQRRRDNNPDFRWEYESYEMFTCHQAVAFAEEAVAQSEGEEAQAVAAFWANRKRWQERYRDTDKPPTTPATRWLYWWNSLPYDRQKKHMPKMDDGHSGNTFGAAVNLARLYIECPERVPDQYGALAPLVGSKDYGDIPPE